MPKMETFRVCLFCSLLAVLSFSACERKSGTAARNDESDWRQSFKTGVVGDWEEIHGSQETMHFNEDGTLIMNAPLEHHSCTYDFPDSTHIRLDCAVPQLPHAPKTYGFALADDKLMISDARETGTYRKR